MTQGFLVFAHNNEQIDYGLLALAQAKRIKKILNKPVSIVLDEKTEISLINQYPNCKDYFDHIIRSESLSTQTKRYGDGANQLTFHNADRTAAYDLSPYDETIVIDGDVLIQTDNLNKLWNNSEELLVCDKCTDINGELVNEFKWISDKSIKFYWATVFYFRKTDYTKIFFNYCRYIKQMYGWMSHVYEIPNTPIRNDFIWSIALHELEHPASSIPFNLIYTRYNDRLLLNNIDSIRFLHDEKISKVKSDVHIFNKYDLMELAKKELS